MKKVKIQSSKVSKACDITVFKNMVLLDSPPAGGSLEEYIVRPKWRTTAFLTFAFLLFTFVSPAYAVEIPFQASQEAKISSNSTRLVNTTDNADSGCKRLSPEECALKLTNIATVPESISKSITLEKPEAPNTVQTLINSFLGFLGFKVNNPQTYSSRSDVQVKTAIPPTAQSTDLDPAKKTGENIGFNQKKVDDEKEVLGVDSLIQQGVGIYQFMLPKEVQDSYIDGESISFTCGYENSQYPTGIRPINGAGSQTECNDALGIK